ncbi:hypothetical protein EG68_03954 [Paragonimus skrjabini miyazakii]|uniref:UspA domain-containing protein n=1 Tax=Paragonimus skrjabini miyazakii TaxID=59628 RepID=A0A8S9Z5D8_9TREM|nr:hypothetical protein EG68_03954 [Paragonimus skrjabini miyazakii]
MVETSSSEVEQHDAPSVLGEVKKRVILLPTDGSPHSERAFSWYLENLKMDNDVVKFINVIEPVYTTPAIDMNAESPPVFSMTLTVAEYIETGKRLCQQCVQKAKAVNVSAQAFIHVDNRPGPALIKAIVEHHADVVIMGNRGVGVVRRTFLGSVSDYVLHHAHIAVVIVPPEVRDAN